MDREQAEARIAASVRAHHAQTVALSDDLYAHPELSDEEYRSSGKVVELLRAAGYEVEYPFAGRATAFRAVIDNGEGPTAAILVEYDALPGVGHACGHNVSCAMSTLAALSLADLKDTFPGKLYVIGTPAEEGSGAKVPMANQGVFDDLDAAMMVHCWSGGTHAADMDVLSLKCYVVTFTGVSAHAAAAPWDGHNALTAARKFLDLVDARRESFTPDVRVCGIVTDGGKAPNVLPDRAQVRIEFRTAAKGRLQALDRIIVNCSRGAALAMDCEAAFEEGFESFDDMVCVPALEQEVIARLTAKGQPCTAAQPPTGSSDVGNVSYRCPTIQPLYSISDTFYALHTDQFREETIKPAAHEAIAQGAELIAGVIYRVLTDETFRTQVQRSFLAQRARKLNA